MKDYRKNIRKITVNGDEFLYSVVEKSHNVVFRTYSGINKSSFFEVSFSWGDYWYVNLYKPAIAANLIEFALQNSWNYTDKNQKLIISDGGYLIKELSLSE